SAVRDRDNRSDRASFPNPKEKNLPTAPVPGPAPSLRPRPPRPQGQQVVIVAVDGTMHLQPDLRSAINATVNGRGYVLLNNPKPLTFSASEAFTAPGGSVTVRAADGTQPELHVEVKGGAPFLTTHSNSPLRLEGVTIVARYVESSASPAPVIAAGSDLTLERCAFRLEGPVPGSRAVLIEGGALTATGCCFEGFDRAIDVSCFGGKPTTVRQCLFVHGRNPEPPAPGGAGGGASEGWAVRMRKEPGVARTGRHLVMDRCTAHGRGFLDLAGFSPQAPVTVDLSACAVLA